LETAARTSARSEDDEEEEGGEEEEDEEADAFSTFFHKPFTCVSVSLSPFLVRMIDVDVDDIDSDGGIRGGGKEAEKDEDKVDLDSFRLLFTNGLVSPPSPA
jgi:hypothetical protein